VVDFIAPRWFYIFNGADSCITVGLVLITIASLRPAPRPNQTAPVTGLEGR
jgi:lipoprotein signal peptidase